MHGGKPQGGSDGYGIYQHFLDFLYRFVGNHPVNQVTGSLLQKSCQISVFIMLNFSALRILCFFCDPCHGKGHGIGHYHVLADPGEYNGMLRTYRIQIRSSRIALFSKKNLVPAPSLNPFSGRNLALPYVFPSRLNHFFNGFQRGTVNFCKTVGIVKQMNVALDKARHNDSSP